MKSLLKKIALSLTLTVGIISAQPLMSANAKTNQHSTSNKKVISSEEEVIKYAKENNLPLENQGKKISEIIINTDTNAEKQLEEKNIQISPRIGDVCKIISPYEGYNTKRIAWSTSGPGPGTLSNTVTRSTTSEVFGQFSGKTSVIEATVGFRIGESTACTSSYSVTLKAGEHARIVGYFRYKGYFVKYYTWGGLNYVGTYEVGRPIGIDFVVYK